MDTKLIEYAQSKFENVDAIANIFTMQVEWARPETAQELGYTQEEIIGISGRELMAVDSASFMKLISLLMDSKNKEDSQLMKKKGGTVVNTSAVINGFTFEGIPYIAVCSLKILGETKKPL